MGFGLCRESGSTFSLIHGAARGKCTVAPISAWTTKSTYNDYKKQQQKNDYKKQQQKSLCTLGEDILGQMKLEQTQAQDAARGLVFTPVGRRA
jgi:hypothetical protein